MPILDRNTLEFISRSPEQTRRVGIRLGSLLQVGDIVCLEGDLGSGKTTLVQGIAQGWGSPSKVTSPTYVIVNEYPRPDGNTLFHCDAYRLQPENPLDSAILDLDRAFKVGALVVEWAERLKDTLPRENLWIQMDWINEDQRHLILVPHGRRYETVLKKLQQSLFGG